MKGDLRIIPESTADPDLRVVWRGKSNDRDPLRFLSAYFTLLLDAASQRTGRRIEMHFEHLDHFNSSTIAALIQLVQDARKRGVKLALLFDGRLKWQKLSFDALRVLSQDDGMLELRAVQEA